MTIKRVFSPALILALLLALIASAIVPASVSTAHAEGVTIFASPFRRSVSAGETQKVWIHTIALAGVSIKVDYGNGQVVTAQATTNAQGIHQFEWTAAYTGSAVALARYWVYVTRGAIYSSTRGDFVLFPQAPFAVNVDVQTPRLHVGDTLRVHVRSKPGVMLALYVRDQAGDTLLTRVAQAGMGGEWYVSTPLSATIKDEQRLQVIVTGDLYGRHAVATGGLTLRPLPAPLSPDTAGNPSPSPSARSLSLAAARRQARVAADGVFSLAQSNARAAVQDIVTNLQVLGQFNSSGVPHTAAYYQDLLGKASSYDGYVEATAQALSDSSAVQARMRLVMPHKAVMVSLQEQALRAYEDGQLMKYTVITTGRPELPTVTGHYAIYEKVSPYKFISPWPQGSKFYYPPTWIKYWMPFYSGYGLHDAWWRSNYGPGTNVGGDGPSSSEPTGTHGCVNIPYANTVWLWNWAPVGTPVVVYGGPNVKAGNAGI
jgi:lipoprotein-anchoring transpeptidase ErfK/SrfK